ncbi:unnamed protein product, partial [Ectocarpus sp. 12 AP-2014]
GPTFSSSLVSQQSIAVVSYIQSSYIGDPSYTGKEGTPTAYAKRVESAAIDSNPLTSELRLVRHPLATTILRAKAYVRCGESKGRAICLPTPSTNSLQQRRLASPHRVRPDVQRIRQTCTENN